MRVRIEIDDEQKILLKRGMNKNGNVQILFTRLCDKYMDIYVPFDTGNLKDFSKTVRVNEIEYNTPYARRQYFENKGTGPKSNGRRGRFWDKRMWIAHGDTLCEDIANRCEGKRG